jgi:hypothetical protein
MCFSLLNYYPLFLNLFFPRYSNLNPPYLFRSPVEYKVYNLYHAFISYRLFPIACGW